MFTRGRAKGPGETGQCQVSGGLCRKETVHGVEQGHSTAAKGPAASKSVCDSSCLTSGTNGTDITVPKRHAGKG